MDDTVYRQAAIDAADKIIIRDESGNNDVVKAMTAWKEYIKDLPSAQPESCEYYALCRHGRDESKLRTRLGICEYCNEDSDGLQ